ncbi:zinc-dependent alcohol dehydrogenase family protein [Kibdelosporangium phytohabitans]|uniref:NADPH:quinone oxidoreductase n=1 Tax=Kibdelosporangium phytohabitans TaxID=860235 RepID=A0A0N9I8L0_9PSEU|nr:NAD(P)-dependent alcohol dehydrogenase [Kibdelosporangium phytohabitans]ALG12251.1 NADPH:quinone oxidoreductase [Kibdelosporangium phytohabitans]MBE1463797.1 NADPH:quinone reductase-like Zn-dependent oxidoreductase [Kibdelosporangium phytohabitans]
MRSYRLDAGAGLDGLRLDVSELPVPGPGEVLVEVRAASLSYREAMILEGRYVLPVRDGGIPLAEGVGVVSATGPDVDGPPLGTRVVVAAFPRWQDGPFSLDVIDQIGGSLDGLLAEHVVLPATALVEISDDLADLTDAEAATLPVAGLTAWNALTGGRGIRRGDTVVTLGTGGVSLFAVQLATALGARVIATTGSSTRTDVLRELGADVVVNYRDTPDWPAAVRTATGGRGADLVVEVAGSLESSLAAVALGGEIAVVGFVGGRPAASLDPIAVFAAGATLRPVAIGSRAQLAALLEAVRTHRIRPVLGRVFPFDDAPEAFRHYLSGTASGKVVITLEPTRDNGKK